jgi:hypothetical protein
MVSTTIARAAPMNRVTPLTARPAMGIARLVWFLRANVVDYLGQHRVDRGHGAIIATAPAPWRLAVLR